MEQMDRSSIEQTCRALVVALVHLQDHGEAEQAAALFTKCGVWHRAGQPIHGREQIHAMIAARPPNRLIRHLATTIKIDVVDARQATGVTYYLAYRHDAATDLVLPVPLGNPFSIGEWHDTFVATADGWRLDSRETKRLFQHWDR